MIFSQRYHRSLQEGRLTVEIEYDARRKIFSCLDKYNGSLGVRRDPNDNWVSNSSVVEEVILELMSQHGWDAVPGIDPSGEINYYLVFKYIITDLTAEHLFDTIEIYLTFLSQDEREQVRVRTNQIFDLHRCPWRLADGEFFKLDTDFVGERLVATAHDALTANNFAGAAQEYSRARQNLASGDIKDCIFYAGKSFESVLKVLTNQSNLNADQLVKTLVDQGYFDDLPEDIRSGFAQQVLKTLPFLRNKLAGHGQGAKIIEVPPAYGELGLQLAAAFHNFLISKNLERKPPPPASNQQAHSSKSDPSFLDDDIPF